MNPGTVEEVITDFKGRRSAIIKALTHDFDKFYELCHPNSSNQLCLYGFPDEHWDVNPPLNSELLDPKMGINIGKDSRNRDDWRSMVAVHSEVWLHAVASYFAIKFKFNTTNRKRLFDKIMGYPPICQVLITRPTMERAGKRVIAIIEDLPKELLFLIFARLPVKDLLKYRSVSKKICALIDDPDFIHTHLDIYSTNGKGSPLLVVNHPPLFNRKMDHISLRSRETFRKVKGLDHVEKVPNSDFFTCLGYINGLMLFCSRVRHSLDLILWNPSINKCLNVSCSALQDVENTDYEFGLGFDASCNDYKVVAILCSKNFLLLDNPYLDDQSFHGSDPTSLQVYTLSTKSWTTKVGVNPPRNRINGPQVFVNGTIHWMNAGPDKHQVWSYKKRNSHVVAFDVSKEVFSYMKLPSEIAFYDDDLTEKRLIVIEGAIGIFCSYGNDTHHVWVMEQYGVPASWVIRYRFNFKLCRPWYFMSNGELFFATTVNQKGVYAYDVKKKLLRKISKISSYFFSVWIMYNYVESLVLL